MERPFLRDQCQKTYDKKKQHHLQRHKFTKHPQEKQKEPNDQIPEGSPEEFINATIEDTSTGFPFLIGIEFIFALSEKVRLRKRYQIPYFLIEKSSIRPVEAAPPRPPLPQYFNTDRSKAVLLLWFLTVTCSCFPYLYFG